jgi:PAS domain S-box-containing protein
MRDDHHIGRTQPRSLANRLIYIVLRWYLAFAVIATMVQLGLEYRSISSTIAGDLISLSRSFGPSVREAMWAFDRPLLDTMTKGIAQTAFISGVRIESASGEVMASAGRFPQAGQSSGTGLLSDFQQHVIPLEQISSNGTTRMLGRMTLYSDRAIVLDRIRYSFLVILFNSLIKTAGLWLIFYWVVRRWLVRPLRSIADSVSELRFDERHVSHAPIVYQHNDEIGVLVDALNRMRGRVDASRGELDTLNRQLEQTVQERTRMLNETLDFNRTLISNSPFGFLAYRADGKCILANQAAADIVGGTDSELLNQNFRELSSWQSTGLLQVAEAALATGEAAHRQCEIQTVFGKHLWLDWTFSVFVLYGELHLLAIMRDVTEVRAGAEAMRRAKEIAEEAQERAFAANRSKSEFLANMSHEIRTPINAISGFTVLARRTDLTPKQSDYLGKIHSATQGLIRIINDLLDFSKIEAGRLDMECVPFDLREVLDTMQAYVDVMAREKGLPLLVDIHPDVPTTLHGDPLRLGQVLSNLCSNAVKFTDQGRVEVNVELAGMEDGRATLLFKVHDSGIGLTPEQAARLFQPFSQADASTTRRFGGTGLGLAISQRLVEMMQGRIWLESMPGEGSLFQFTATLLTMPGTVLPLYQPATTLNTVALPMTLAGVDLTSGLARCRSDSRLYRSLLIQFRKTFADTESRIAALLESQDNTGLAGLVHTLRGAAANLAMHELATDASALENLLGNKHGSDHSGAVGHADSVADATDSSSECAQAPGTNRLAGHRILLVEDNVVNQQLAFELLAAEGAHVQVARNGRIAVDLLTASDRNRFDVVLMDLQMPEMDGHEAAQRIRRFPRGAQVPIIAMTAHAMNGERERCLGAGMNDHIAKPLDPEELIRTILCWSRTGRSMPIGVPPEMTDMKKAINPIVPELAGPERQKEISNLADTLKVSLRKVIAGLEQLEQAEPASGVSQGTDSSRRSVALREEFAPLLDELQACLAHNDTGAEEIVAQLQALAGNQVPGWLARAAEAVYALEYEVALQHLQEQAH